MNRRSMTTALLPFCWVAAAAPALTGCGAAAGPTEPLGSEEALLADSKCPDVVPASLTPAADQRLFFTLHGEGVQIYQCSPSGGGFAWVFVAPEADLLDPGGQVVGLHYAGPTWQSEDGSTVVGAKKAAAAAPNAGAIPWLLLTAVSHDGQGKMRGVTSIQRLATEGGVAPASGCDADHAGAIARVPYTAGYFFYQTSQGHGQNPQCGG